MKKAEMLRWGIALTAAATGWALGVMSSKKRHAEAANRDIESVKKTFARMYPPKKSDISTVDVDKIAGDPGTEHEEVNKLLYSETLKEKDFTDYSGKSHLISRKPITEIQMLLEDEYDSFIAIAEYDYKEELLSYFIEDDILLDERDEVVADRARHVGDTIPYLKGKYEDKGVTRVFAVNHNLETAYEIMLDFRKYREVIGEL